MGLRVTTTNADLASWLEETFGGRIYPWNPRDRRRAYNWTLTGKRAAVMLEATLPYLRVKSRPAHAWLAFWRLAPAARRTAGELRAAIRAA